MTFEQVKQDILDFCSKYDFVLKKISDSKKTVCSIRGYINIYGSENFCLGSFLVAYIIDLTKYYQKESDGFSYPRQLPKVCLISNDEYKHIEYHIDEAGLCCLAPDVECSYILGKEYNLEDFTQKLVIPFFSSLLIKLKIGEWPYGDYTHYEEGLFNYYRQRLKVDKKHVVLAIEIMVGIKKIERNQICFCGSGRKYKKCHLTVLEDFHRKVEIKYLERDLATLIK